MIDLKITRQVSNIRRTKSQHLNDPRTVLRLSLPNPLNEEWSTILLPIKVRLILEVLRYLR